MESDTHLLYFTKLSEKSLDFYILVGIHLNIWFSEVENVGARFLCGKQNKSILSIWHNLCSLRRNEMFAKYFKERLIVHNILYVFVLPQEIEMYRRAQKVCLAWHYLATQGISVLGIYLVCPKYSGLQMRRFENIATPLVSCSFLVYTVRRTQTQTH